MSFGDQNNPYGAPQQAPGYGYPQQPQGGQPGQPYAAYPQAQGGYAGAPQGPQVMPGITKAARIMLYAIAAVHVIVAGLCVAAVAAIGDAKKTHGGGTVTTAQGDTVDADTVFDAGKGVFAFLAALAVIFAILGIILAVRYAKGANGVRVGSIVYAAFGIISGLVCIVFYGIGLIGLILSILVIVFAAKQASQDWFRRPRF
ncbi:hypothetical protein [Streptomyces telluris]|uniref:Uncharacterized protein n=1 Tax=Streptomyces telluris TaxID=2720021 RepID=A0A9X2LDM7_9ACTN|nr:hypothetical protein [Streptomyces telluris]MCQ8769285.1 hypothetical protein [Streptomyces telluris]NJP79211.1 hypothetical protein [Streptomyces telluris]